MADRVWGLDLGGNRFHLCGPGDSLYHLFLDTDKAQSKGGWKGRSQDDRRRACVDEFANFLGAETSIHDASRSHIFCEYPIALKNGKTTIMLAQMSGAMWRTAQDFNIFWHWVEISTWKKQIVKGNAGKPEIREWCEAMGFHMPEGIPKKEGEDFFDTRCIREYGERALLLAEAGAEPATA